MKAGPGFYNRLVGCKNGTRTRAVSGTPFSCSNAQIPLLPGTPNTEKVTKQLVSCLPDL